MASISYNKQRVLNILEQIVIAVGQLKNWNRDVSTSDDYYLSDTGMQKLAASCMLIEAIGESVNQIDQVTKGELFRLRPEIPWGDIIGIRNHIAHGYFDIDADVVLQVIKEDLDPFLEAVQFLRTELDS